MLGAGAGRIKRIDVKKQLLCFVKWDEVFAQQGESIGGAYVRELGIDTFRIDLAGLLAQQTEHDSAVGAVAFAGVGERAIEIDDDVIDTREQ
jgi:hypothetical protein